MSSFLTLVSPPEFQGERTRLFRHAVRTFRDAKDRAPSATTESDWASAAAFARLNGTAGGLVTGDPSGTWLTAPGSWFHRNGFRSGDEARLLARYLEVGAERLADELEGFFAIVIGDERAREVLVFTDIAGGYFVYARSWEHGTAVSSSSLALAGLAPVTLDRVGCQEFLRAGYVQEDRSFYREIRKLAPSTIHRIPMAAPRSERRYWAMGDLSPDLYRGRSAKTRLEEELLSSAARIGKAFSKPVLDLTGGYDSRVVCAGFRKAGIPFEAVVSGLPTSNDVIISKGLARAAGLKHNYIPSTDPVTWEEAKRALTVTDGEYDMVDYGRVFRNHQQLLRRFDVTVNGSYGEFARGLYWEVLFPRIGARRPLDARRVASLRLSNNCSYALAFPPAEAFDPTSHFAGIIERTNAEITDRPNTFQMDHVHLRVRLQRWQGRIASSTDQLWPCLSQFMLRPVLDTVFQIREWDRRHSSLSRHMLVDLDPLFASYPMEHGYPPLPLAWNNLHRFWPVPLHVWKRVRKRFFPPSAPVPATPNGGPPHVRFKSVEEVQELLRPSRMRVGELTGEAALTEFLRGPGTARRYEQTWARVLSLEYTLQVLDKLGRP